MRFVNSNQLIIQAARLIAVAYDATQRSTEQSGAIEYFINTVQCNPAWHVLSQSHAKTTRMCAARSNVPSPVWCLVCCWSRPGAAQAQQERGPGRGGWTSKRGQSPEGICRELRKIRARVRAAGAPQRDVFEVRGYRSPRRQQISSSLRNDGAMVCYSLADREVSNAWRIWLRGAVEWQYRFGSGNTMVSVGQIDNTNNQHFRSKSDKSVRASEGLHFGTDAMLFVSHVQRSAGDYDKDDKNRLLGFHARCVWSEKQVWGLYLVKSQNTLRDLVDMPSQAAGKHSVPM